MLKKYEFNIRINGQPYELAKGFTFSRDIKLMSSAFELQLIDPDLALIKNFTPSQECQIEIDRKILAKVYFKSVSIDDKDGHVFTYYGRDRAGDLVDCSASFSDGGFERSNITLDEAIRDILKPFNMPLTVAVDVGKPFPKISITPGDSVFNVIDQLCKYRAAFALSDGVGGLIITSVSQIRSGGSLIVGDDGNVLSRTGMIDYGDRFSQITVKGQADGAEFGDAPASALCTSEGHAYDKGITRHRPLIIIAEKDGYDLDMQERAIFEARHRRFIGTAITYTVQGWEAAENEFWRINTLIPIRDPQLNIARDMLAKRVSLSRGEDGTLTQIGVAPAEAYDLPAYKQPEDDAVFGGF